MTDKRFKVEKKIGKEIYELNDNDSAYYNFHENKLLARWMCNLLNELYDETVERNAQLNQLLEKVDEIHYHDIEVLNKFAEKYNRESSEFNLICDIGEELGVTISLLKASDDDD